ncbi:MAG: hypothetical protein ISR65_01505 [Bacteriovoracaceae bacterium]|nr:hypothetical protein [Bacteriovoracaceae bacterium]
MIKKRLVATFIGISFLFLLIMSKASYVQIVNKDKLIAYSTNQILRESKIYPNRGNIYDRNSLPLAINVQTYSIFTIPKNVKGGKKSYKRLSKIVPKLSYRKIMKKIHKRTRYTWLARKIELSKKQVKKVKKLGSEGGIFIEVVPKRLYPNNELLSQVLGFVGVDNVGLSGLEYYFDERLKGKARITKYLKDAKGRPIKFEVQKSGDKSQDIYLSIDNELQALSEKLLKEMVVEFQATKGGIGVIDATTGEILAIANYPTFDANKIKNSNAEYRKLAFISDPFEPGSILKVLTVASALEHKMARPDTNYYCERGKYMVGGHYISEAETKKKFEWLSMTEILQYSSNIGTTKIAFDLTFPRLKETLLKFRIGQKVGIQIPGESRGIFSSKKNISPLVLSNISFGQGIATTGIQMLAVYAAIANGGVYIKPTILRRNKSENIISERIISQSTADELTKMLIKAVEDGTGDNARIPHFKIAGKTSTAQKPAKSGGYEGYIPGFIGFPVNIDNRFVVYAYADDPKGKIYYGNNVAAPIFKKVTQHILYKHKNFKQVFSKDKAMDSVAERKSATTRILGKKRMPNFLGLDKLSAIRLGKKLKVTVKIIHKGMGVVTSQGIKAGSVLKENALVELIYTPPTYE